MNCPFCNLLDSRIMLRSSCGFVLPDAYPVVPDHMLVVPRRHVASIFDLEPEEYADLWNLAARFRREPSTDASITGWNIGINDGESAGQTVPHAHIHMIPRRKGDCEDPRGGIRLMFPAKARYWE